VRIAASKGKEDLKSKNIIIKPVLYNCEDDYVVIVESQKDSSCRKASVVEAGKTRDA
jgi:hypothetical protein